MQKFKSVSELVNRLKPSEPVYCIRTSSIRTASGYFQKNFPTKLNKIAYFEKYFGELFLKYIFETNFICG